MATASFRGDSFDEDDGQQYDAFGNPIASPRSAQDPFAVADHASTDSGDNAWDDAKDFVLGDDDAAKDAVEKQKQNEERWKAVGQNMPTADDLTVDINGEYEFGDHKNDLHHYSPGSRLDLSGAKNDLVNPDGTLKTDSAAEGLVYGGPAQDGRNAQLAGIDYWDNLINGNGHDAASDATYEGYRSDAEQAGRAQREAGMQDLREKGMGHGGSAVLNEMMAARDVSNQAHQGALQAAALGQARKDNAASSLGTAGSSLSANDLAASQDKNRFGLNVADRTDDWDKYFFGEKSDYGKGKSDLDQNESVSNFNRENATLDANTGVDNEALYHNLNVPQQTYENLVQGVQGLTGAGNATAGALGAVPQQNVVTAVGKGVDSAAKVYQMSHGQPVAAPSTASKEEEDEKRGRAY